MGWVRTVLTIGLAGGCVAAAAAGEMRDEVVRGLPPVQLAQATAAPAQTATRADFEAAFQAMLADPGNAQKTLRFAEIASAFDDPEAAIAALERFLLLDREQAKVNLELGVLYYRLGSHEAARRYLQRSVAAADSTPATRDRANVFLAEIDRATRISRLTGSVTVGLRYQSNANFGPDSNLIRRGGIATQLPTTLSKESDWNAFVLSYLQHVYDLGTQDGTTIETNATLYGTRHFSESNLNLGLAEITSGPRFRPLVDSAPGFSVRPHVIGNMIMVDDSRFSSAGGFGIDLRQEYSPALTAELTYNLRYRDYRSSARRPTADELTGVENSILLGGRYALTSATRLGLDLLFARDNAEKAYNDNYRIGFLAGITHSFNAPFALTSGAWTATLYGGFTYVDYDAPDPRFDPNTKRNDREWRVGVRGTVPIVDSWSVLWQVEHLDNDSSLPNFTYKNTLGLAGVTFRF